MIALSLLSSPLLAATLTVDAGGGGDYTTIQAALFNAASGDLIEVEPGTYAGAVDFMGREVTVRATGGPEQTVIDGAGAAWAVSFDGGEGPGAVLEGFTVINAGQQGLYISGASPTLRELVLEGLGAGGDYGGAVYSVSGSPAFEAVQFDGNEGIQGAHAYLHGGSPSFTDCTFANGAAQSGGAVMIYDGASVRFEGGSFASNIASANGGAVALYSSASATFVDVSFTANRANQGGGALWAGAASALTLSGGALSQNFVEEYTLYNGGGVYLDATSSLHASGALFQENYAAYGGAIHTDGGPVSLDAVELDANWSNTGGGAIAAFGRADISDLGGDWHDNWSYGSGGAVLAYSAGHLSLDGTAAEANLSYYGHGGAVYVYDSTLWAGGARLAENYAYYNGGAIYAYYTPGAASVAEACTFEGNSTTYGNGAALYGYYYADWEVYDSSFRDNVSGYAAGGLYSNYYSSVTVSGSTFEGNASGTVSPSYGGAVVVIPYNGLLDGAWVSGSTFEDNTTVGEGGGLYVSYADQAEVEDSRFVNNQAGEDRGGGGLYLFSVGATTVRGNLIANNRASYGGGAYVEAASSATAPHRWSNNIIQENRARYGGGLCFVETGNPGYLTITNNDLLGNSGTEGGGGLCLYEATADFRNNVVAYQTDGEGVAVYDQASAAASSFAYNDLYENLEGNLGGELRPADMTDGLEDRPLFASYSRDGDPDNDQLTLAAGSALIDAGDPAITDPDGSPSDIGAMGGPGAPRGDEDGDGYKAFEDCDDGDAAIYPGAPEVYYDGVNSDCDPASDYDADGDGHDSDAYGGDDCDDADADTWEGCEDSGTTDGGTTDGGTTDGGTTDGGTTDGGTTDGGSTDGGSTDGGTTDGTDGGALERPPLEGGEDPKGCGCAATGGGDPAGLTGLLVLIGAIALRRRRASTR